MQENYPSFIGLLFFTLVALKINYLLLRSIRPGIWKSLNVFTLLACVIFWLNFLYQKRLFSEYCFFHYTLSLKDQVKDWIMTTWGCQGCGRRDQGLKAICSGLKKVLSLHIWVRDRWVHLSINALLLAASIEVVQTKTSAFGDDTFFGIFKKKKSPMRLLLNGNKTKTGLCKVMLPGHFIQEWSVWTPIYNLRADF